MQSCIIHKLFLFNLLISLFLINNTVWCDELKCQQGPYLYVATNCTAAIGFDNRIRLLASHLSLALALNLSYVSPFKHCWLEGMGQVFDRKQKHLATEFLEFIGWRRNAAGVSCTAEALNQLKDSSAIQIVPLK
jgi:hypothetical protein